MQRWLSEASTQRRATPSPVPRKLESKTPAYDAYVRASRDKGSAPPVPDTVPNSELTEESKNALDPLQQQLNAAANEKERMNILANSYNDSSTLSQSIKSRDMAMWFALETNLKEVKDA
ncbi:hypothetical protein ATCC90586_011969 [Pythium insidiosum]|nr:hypothetical protein ATCC90586_011969 [Pythium insidiosum]